MDNGPVPPVRTTINKIIRGDAFHRGVAEIRAGLPPHFDRYDDWDYERGRQWALVAPHSMPLMIGRKVNPEAF
jgi:hypothetical protein